MSNVILPTLAALNALRIDLGMSPLKSWKESFAKLQAAIDKLQARKDEIVAAGPSIIEQQVAEAKAANERIARLEASAKNKPVKVTKVTDNLTGEVKLPGDATPKQVKKITVAKPDLAAMPATKKLLGKAPTSPKVKAAVKKLAQKTGSKAAKVEGSVNVSEIAKELGVNPKVARATLRRKNVDRTDAAAVRAALTK